MRSLCLIIILFAFFAQIKSYAACDDLMYKGEKYRLESCILFPYLKKAGKWEWLGEQQIVLGPLLGIYSAKFEIVGNELILKDIGNGFESRLKEFLSTFAAKDSIFKMSWFTDSIVIGKDEPLYDDIHEYYSVLHFEKGKLIKETRMSYKGYLNNKLKKQLESLSKADDKTGTELGKVFEDEIQEKLDIIEHYLEIKKGDKSEFLTKLKTKYEKRFGKPMSNLEFRIQRISFRDEYQHNTLEIIRTLYGARARYFKDNPYESIRNVKLNAEEWLDFIRALYICCIDKWEPISEPLNKNYGWAEGGGYFYIYFSFSVENSPYYDERYVFPIKSGQQTTFKEFQKVLEDIIVKMRKNPAKL